MPCSSSTAGTCSEPSPNVLRACFSQQKRGIHLAQKHHATAERAVILRSSGTLRRCSCSHAISARAGSAAAAPQKSSAGTGYRPELLVLTDRNLQKLDSFFMPISQLPSSGSQPATATRRGPDHEEANLLAETLPASSSAVQQEVLPSAEGSGQEGQMGSKRARRLEDTTSTLAAAARERLQLEAHAGAQLCACRCYDLSA